MTSFREPNREEIYSKNSIEFLTVTNEFCKFLESIDKYRKAETFTFLQRILPLIYLKATLLPDVDIIDDTMDLSPLTEEEYNKINENLSTKFGKDDKYWDIDNQRNFVKEDSIIQISLSEMLSDIYQETKNFVEIFQHGKSDAKQSILFQCRTNFENEWGNKLLSALKVIHSLSYFDIDVKIDV
ncbi:MAG: DUF5063 domain-containing protein [Bacteroidota bacterium]